MVRGLTVYLCSPTAKDIYPSIWTQTKPTSRDARVGCSVGELKSTVSKFKIRSDTRRRRRVHKHHVVHTYKVPLREVGAGPPGVTQERKPMGMT